MNSKKTTEKETTSQKGITLDDLYAKKTIKAQLISSEIINVKGKEKPSITVKFMEGDLEGNTAKYGIVSDTALQRLLENGEKVEVAGETVIFVYVTPPDDTKEISWLKE